MKVFISPLSLAHHSDYAEPFTEGESSKKLSAAIERLVKLGVKVTDATCKGKAIGIVGGVRRPKLEVADDSEDTSSKRW